jgi:hypothetical protein
MAAPELHCPPRYGTARSPERPTLGGNVAKVAEALGKPFLPHQRLICDVALEIDPDTGYLAYDEVVIIGPRQVTGKTELTLPVMAHRCLGFDAALVRWIGRELGRTVPAPGPQRVLFTAQTADEARKKWRDVHVGRLKESPYASKIDVRLKTNAEQIRWPNGSTWSPASTTGKTAGTGDTIDLAMLDEYWSREDNRTEVGLRPAMLTRPWRQLWKLSMIPAGSRVPPSSWAPLRTARQNGRSRVQAGIRSRVAYFEWSAPEGADPGDPETWWSCMPALGHTVQERAVRSDFESTDLSDFCAEYLGWEPSPQAARWNVVSEATWRNLTVPNVQGAYSDPIALGVDAQPDQSAASVGMSALTPSGDTYVEVIERRPGITWVVDALVELCQRHWPCAVGVAAHGPAASQIEPLRRAMVEANIDVPIVAMQGPDVAKACAQFYAETGEVGEFDGDTGRRIAHIGQPELDASVAGAAKYTFSDEWRWMRSGEVADASPLYAVTLARAAGESVEWVGGTYNISDSLG